MTSKPSTATDLAATIRFSIEAGIEAAEPADTILEYLKLRNGKTLTKRDEANLRAIPGAEQARISKSAGMTHIEWGGYGRSGGREGGSLLIAYTEGAPAIDAAWIEERNACYYSARVERNAARGAALANPEAIQQAADAVVVIRAARKVLEELLGYGAPLHVVSSEIELLLGEDRS